MRYVWDREHYAEHGVGFIPADEYWAKQPKKVGVHTVLSDLPEYISPLSEPGTRPVVIDGRAQRREELRRNNLREVDPSEWSGK